LSQRAAIIISYGSYLGWLLTFPYSGPVLEELAAHRGYSHAILGLVYTVIPVAFLTILLFIRGKSAHAKSFMLAGTLISLLGSAVVYFAGNREAYFVMGIMGIASVTFIVGWSKYYGDDISLADKMPVMALVIALGNLIEYVLLLLLSIVPFGFIFFASMLPLLVALVATTRLSSGVPGDRMTHTLQPFPWKLMAIVCAFMFILNVNGGLMFQAIQPYLKQQTAVVKYYAPVPYILTAIVYYFLGRRVPRFLPMYIATSQLGLAFLAFAFFAGTLAGDMVVETLAQAGWALIDIFLWTLMGEIASIYGRPMQVCTLAMSANLAAVFTGGLIGFRLTTLLAQQAVLASGLLAASMVFVTFLIVPFMNSQIEWQFAARIEASSEPSTAAAMPPLEQEMRERNLTNRQMEIVRLMLQGRGNREIAETLCISENTLKVHARSIYAKMGVANKRELMHLAIASNNHT
jgi:DNA-binding CsgD family transcriptional regulator